MCFYDPTGPYRSAIDNMIPVGRMTLLPIASWGTLAVGTYPKPGFTQIVPLLSGIASAVVLLNIAVSRFPTVDFGLFGAILLLILAVLAPAVRSWASKFHVSEGIVPGMEACLYRMGEEILH